MKIAFFFALLLVSAFSVQNEYLSKMDSAVDTPMLPCEDIPAQIAYYQNLIDTGRCGRRCASTQAQLDSLQDQWDNYCASPSSSPSASEAPPGPPGPCQCLNYGSLTVNAMTRGNFYGSSDSEGPLYIGGNAALEHGFSVGIDDSFKRDGQKIVPLLANGDIDFPSGRVYNGDIFHSGGANIGSTVLNGLEGQVRNVNDTWFTVGSAMSYYNALSQYLCSVPKTADIVYNDGVVSETRSNSNPEIYEIECSELESFKSIAFNGFPAENTIIINIKGTGTCTLAARQKVANYRRTLINVCSADSFITSNTAIMGSILAPSTEVTGNGGTIYGTLIAQSFTGSLQFNYRPCEACLEVPGHFENFPETPRYVPHEPRF